MPLHHKIRFSFAGLRALGLVAVSGAHSAKDLLIDAGASIDRRLKVDHWIALASSYIDQLLERSEVNINLVRHLCEWTVLPRYIGIVRVSATGFDDIDVLVDTTSTRRNPNVLGVFPIGEKYKLTQFVAEWMAEKLNCPVISPGVRVPRASSSRRRGRRRRA